MHIAIVALGKPSIHLMTGKFHGRGIWGLYHVPIFNELDFDDTNNKTVSQLVQKDWLLTAGSIYIDMYNQMVYITRNDTATHDSYDYSGSDSIDYTHILQRINMPRVIDKSFLVKIESMKG